MDQTSEIIQAPAATVGDQAGQAETCVLPSSLIEGIELEVYREAAEGQINEAISKHREHLHQVLTPTKNTVLHIYIAYATKPTLAKLDKTESWSIPPGNQGSEVNVTKEMLLQIYGTLFKSWSSIYRSSTIYKSKLLVSTPWSSIYKSSTTLKESIDFVNKLLETCPPLLLQPNNSGDTALHIAARNGHAGIAEALIKAAKARRHRDVEKQEDAWQMQRTPNKEGNTALHEAARFNHLDVVKILTREDPDFLHSTNVAGETPIYLAAERGYRNVVFEILDACTHPTYGGHSDRTALHAAVINQDGGMAEKLLEKEKAKGKGEEKIMARATDKQGWTPLHFAALVGDAPIAMKLLDCDKSVAYVGDKVDNKTALHIAASKGHESVMIALISGCPDCCELVDQKGRNILHYAVENKRIGIERIIQGHPWLSNILLNGKDNDGNTPLHQLAVSVSDTSGLLSDYRVDLMALNSKNQNAFDLIPADYSLSMTWQKKKTIMNALRRKGARPGQENGDKKVQKNEIGNGTEDKEAKKVVLLIAILIATVSFAAGFTLPGGYQSEKGPNQGFAVLTKNAAFQAFVITNTIALTASSGIVLSYLYMAIGPLLGKNLESLQFHIIFTFSALIAMTIAFITGMYAVLGGSSRLAIGVCVLGSYLFYAVISRYIPD